MKYRKTKLICGLVISAMVMTSFTACGTSQKEESSTEAEKTANTFVYASEQTRKKRLMADRGYSEQKVEQMFAAQLSDETYRKYCRVVIDNDRDEQYVLEQIKQLYRSEEK